MSSKWGKRGKRYTCKISPHPTTRGLLPAPSRHFAGTLHPHPSSPSLWTLLGLSHLHLYLASRATLPLEFPCQLVRLWSYCCLLRFRPHSWSLSPPEQRQPVAHSVLQFLHHLPGSFASLRLWSLLVPLPKRLSSLICHSPSRTMFTLLQSQWLAQTFLLEKERWGLGYLG